MSITQSHLLTLPRELRNNIYKRVNVVRCITKPFSVAGKGGLPRIKHSSAPYRNLLLTCRQIQAEYDEVWPQGAKITMMIGTPRSGTDFGVNFLKGFPVQALKQVCACRLVVSLGSVYDRLRDVDVAYRALVTTLEHDDLPQHLAEEPQDYVDPSVAASRTIAHIATQLTPLLSSKTYVQLLLTWSSDNSSSISSERSFEDMLLTKIIRPHILRHQISQAFASFAEIEIALCLKLPLFLTLDASKGTTVHGRVSLGQDGSMSMVWESKEKCIWDLVPRKSEQNFEEGEFYSHFEGVWRDPRSEARL